jgi:protein SCO1
VTSSTRRRIVAVTVVAAVTMLGACGGGNGDDRAAHQALSGVVRTPPLEVGTVSLPDETPGADGTPFVMRAQPGGLLLVYFGYTSCPDICPTTLSDIGRALQRLPAADRDRVVVAMATVDPNRDTATVMTSYLDHFVHGGHALRTTDPAQQQQAQDAFRVVAKRVDDGTSYSFEHTAVTYVVDEHGTVVLEWPFGVSPAAMRDDLQTLLHRSAE